MKVKEAIEFLEEEIEYKFAGDYDISLSEVKEYNDGKQKVIELLEQGEKHKTMWEEFQDKYGSEHIRIIPEDRYYVTNTLMNIIKQKYFPKEN